MNIRFDAWGQMCLSNGQTSIDAFRWKQPIVIDSRAGVGVLKVQYVRQDPQRDGGPLGFLLSHLSLLAVSGYSWQASKACKESLFSCNAPSVVIHLEICFFGMWLSTRWSVLSSSCCYACTHYVHSVPFKDCWWRDFLVTVGKTIFRVASFGKCYEKVVSGNSSGWIST